MYATLLPLRQGHYNFLEVPMLSWMKEVLRDILKLTYKPPKTSPIQQTVGDKSPTYVAYRDLYISMSEHKEN